MSGWIRGLARLLGFGQKGGPAREVRSMDGDGAIGTDVTGTNSKAGETASSPELSLADERLFVALKKWADQEAKQSGRGIFTDRTLRQIAKERPAKHDQLLSVQGIGPQKCELFGESVLRIVRAFAAQNTQEQVDPITQVTPEKFVPVRSSGPEIRQRNLMIGLDFGVSTTKSVYRWLRDDIAWVSSSPSQVSDIPGFATPTSLERAEDGQLELGSRAIHELSHSLKYRILQLTPGSVPWNQTERDAIVYLGWYLDQLFKQIRLQQEIETFRPIVNIGVPIGLYADDARRDHLRNAYKRVASAALASTTLYDGAIPFEQGQSSEDCSIALDYAIKASASKEELVRVLPESLAPLVSYERDRASEEGVFSILDIGAGTTEIAVGWLSRNLGQPHLQCNQDRSIEVGAIRFHEAVARGEGEEVLMRWWKEWRACWEAGREIERGSLALFNEWTRSHVIFTGGGSLDESILRWFERRSVEGCRFTFSAYTPGQEVLRFLNPEHDDARLRRMLVCAHGLSFHAREWPKWYSSAEADVYEVEAQDATVDGLNPHSRGWV